MVVFWSFTEDVLGHLLNDLFSGQNIEYNRILTGISVVTVFFCVLIFGERRKLFSSYVVLEMRFWSRLSFTLVQKGLTSEQSPSSLT